jgi:hypothetical protein
MEFVHANRISLNEKENYVKKAFSGGRLGAATVLTAVALVGGSLAMAPTASASTAAATSAPANAPGSKATPDANATGCIADLFRYHELIKVRGLYCSVTAVAAIWDHQHAYVACFSAMITTGLEDWLALLSCSQAAYG